MGRRPIGPKAMTQTEYQRRWRAKQKRSMAQAPRMSESHGSTTPVSSAPGKR